MFDNVANTEYAQSVKHRIDRLKQVHYVVAIALFVGTFVFCSNYDTGFDIKTMSLSHLGIYQKIGWIWNLSLFVVGITLLIETLLNLNNCLPEVKWLKYLFLCSIICLLLTASITMDHRIHFYFAYTYFIGYTLSIFLYGFLLMKTDFRIGITSIILSVSSVICPLLILMYLHSYAIPELAHTTLILTWVSITKYDNAYKNFLKKFGL